MPLKASLAVLLTSVGRGSIDSGQSAPVDRSKTLVCGNRRSRTLLARICRPGLRDVNYMDTARLVCEKKEYGDLCAVTVTPERYLPETLKRWHFCGLPRLSFVMLNLRIRHWSAGAERLIGRRGVGAIQKTDRRDPLIPLVLPERRHSPAVAGRIRDAYRAGVTVSR